MRTQILFLILLISVQCLAQKTIIDKPYEKKADIVMNSKKLKEALPEIDKYEILAEGFEWTEGPVWLPKEHKLIFSDIPNNAVYEWTEKDGIKLWLKPSGFSGRKTRDGEPGSNGLLLSPDGELILCQHGDRRVAKMKASLANPKPEYETVAGEYNRKRLNSPNDAVYHKNGDLYFTDPPYGLKSGMNDPEKELDFQGVYRLNKKGELTLLTKELSRPNGIGFSPDFKKLYVANSDPEKAIWMVYDVDKNGLLTNGKLFFDATNRVKTLKGLPDGLKVHPDGWIFATGPGGVWIFSPEGEHLGSIMTGEATANCTFNSDCSALFLTADDYLIRVSFLKDE